MQGWIADETKTADFGDERLDRRYALLLDRLSDKPTLSIPAACVGTAEVEAAYRFFDNERVSVDRILKPHSDATLERIRQEPVVIIPQDTTELDLTRRHEKVGGPLNDDSRWGIFAHVQLAMRPNRLPLGVLAASIWSRDPVDFARSQKVKRLERKARPIEEKESFRWLEGYRRACVVAKQASNTTIVSVADSEGDIYECFMEGLPAEDRKAEWIVRACQPRVLAENVGDLRQNVLDTKSMGTFLVQVSQRNASTGCDRKRRAERSAREAKVHVRAASVRLRAPNRKGMKLPIVKVNVVLVLEDNPPEGAEPIEWILLTSLPIETLAQAQTVIGYYCCRWEIEIFFRVFKGGCRVEDLQLEATDRLGACMAMYLIVAWRVLLLLMLGRESPETICDKVLSEAEWKSVYLIAIGKELPKQPPSLGEMIRKIAELGGYLGRKSDGPPGPKTLWIGLQRTRDFALAWTVFNSGVRKAKDV